MRKRINELVQKVSGYLEIDAAYFMSGGFWMGIPYILRAFISLLVTALFTRFTTQELFGEYKFFTSILLTLMIFSYPGMGTAILQSVARGYDRSYVDGVRLRIKHSLLGSLSLLLIAGYFFYFKHSQSYIYYAIAALFFPFYHSFQSVMDYLVGKEKFALNSKHFMINILVTNIPLMLVIVFFKDMMSIVLATLIFTCLGFFIFYWAIKKKFAKDMERSRKDRHLAKYAWHLTFMQVIPLAAGNLDKIILPFFLGFKELAIYVVAVSIPQLNKFIISPIAPIILPKLSAHKNIKKLYSFLMRKLPIFAGVSVLINVAGILVTPLAIRLLFTGAYSESVFYAQLSFLAFFFIIPENIFYNFLVAKKKTKSLYKLNTVPDMLKIVLMIVLIPLWGIIGAIVSFTVSRYVFVGMAMYYSRKEARAISA
jgi:O-antigen/teichoic acid export membrane protein